MKKCRIIHPEEFYKKGVLKKFIKCTKKHLESIIFRVTGLRAVTLFKKDTSVGVFI